MKLTNTFILLFIIIIGTSIPVHSIDINSTTQDDIDKKNTQEQQTSPTQLDQQHAIIARTPKAFDFTRTCFFSYACLGISLGCDNQHTKQLLRRLAIVEPIARLIATQKFYFQLCNRLPLVSRHMNCTQASCPGICNHCKLKLIYKEAPLRLGLMLSLNWLINGITNHRDTNVFI
ncbi:MAG: hypothetical protein Q8Q25_00590 [bacterium]|nr:hypothetical protein [bacterium]